MGLKKPKKPKPETQLDPGNGADQDWEKGYVPKSKQGQSGPKKLTPMEKYHQKRMKKMGM